MSNVWSSFLLIVLGVAFSMVGDVFLKNSHTTNYKLLILGILFYALGAIPVALAFTKIQFGTVFLVWEAITVVAALIIATVLFKEDISIYKFLALLFALAALYFSYK